MNELAQALAAALHTPSWVTIARPAQLPPAIDWRIWLLLGGRGSGKTRSASEYVAAEVASGGARHVAVVGRTAADVRDVMVEGPSGLLAIAPGWFRPSYEPSKRRLTWPNGAMATAFSADEPDLLRGPQHDLAWADELAAWEKPDEVWANLMLGLRLGAARCVVSTTPRPIPLIRDLVSRDGTDVALGRMTTFENLPNLSPAFAADIVTRYAGTTGTLRRVAARHRRRLVDARTPRADAPPVRSAPRACGGGRRPLSRRIVRRQC
ncbi:MAG TPA: terminase family protein [bacterium]|nr:terminase family protein [bacterium]